MVTQRPATRLPAMVLGCLLATAALAQERFESFDRDPGWEAHNNRAVEPAPRTVRQDFGYSATSHAGGAAGEIGGYIAAAAEPAYYALKIPASTFDQPLTASGTLACGERPFHVLLGFFNADNIKEWRTPNSLCLRLNGRGEKFYAYVEYATARWRAGGDDPQSFAMQRNPQSGRNEPLGFTSGRIHRWSLSYDPRGGDGHGSITATIDDQTAICNLSAEHRRDGARFNHFGLLPVMKSADDGGELWLDDVTVNGRRFDFASDPGWEGVGNRRTYQTVLIRPRFNFGYSPTQFAGGRSAGELGGTLFRGDCRYPERMAHYADRLEPLSLERPLKASGKIALRRGVSDSGVLLGFFNSQESTVSNPAQDTGLPRSFLGISTDAPSREGFYLSPTYRLAGDLRSSGLTGGPLYLLPDGATHDWSLEYRPSASGGGEVTVRLDSHSVHLAVPAEHRAAGTRFDRFGLITPWVDGNSQDIYFDDLIYTASQP